VKDIQDDIFCYHVLRLISKVSSYSDSGPLLLPQCKSYQATVIYQKQLQM